MEGISDIRIVGIDETRPPRIRKEPYINLFFKLNHKAPVEWCEIFNGLISKRKYPVKIDPDEGLFVDTWVRKPEEIEPIFDALKEAVRSASEEYIERIQAANRAAAEQQASPEDEGEQGRLNRILAGLDFSD
ncbi:MAG: hypothetical protein ACQETD_11715 [Pseudomonadota bacterium]